MSILSIAAAILKLVPGATKAVQAIAAVVRSGPPVKPDPFGRAHHWDTINEPVSCVYCGEHRTQINALDLCPGPKPPTASTPPSAVRRW